MEVDILLVRHYCIRLAVLVTVGNRPWWYFSTVNKYPLFCLAGTSDKSNHRFSRIGYTVNITPRFRWLCIKNRPELFSIFFDLLIPLIPITGKCILLHQDAVTVDQ